MEETLQAKCERLRASLRGIEIEVRTIREHSTFSVWHEVGPLGSIPKGSPEAFPGQHDEMIAQAMLAVRYIEAARMRLGKVLQYSGDGVSIYDKT